MKKYLNVFVAVLLVSSAGMLVAADALPAVAAETTDAPATTQPSAQANSNDDANAIQATIRQVRGIVQYRTGDDQPWQKVEVGQKLGIGVEFRTGPRSSVTFHLPPDQIITLDRLGTLKLLDAVNNDKGDNTVAKTDLGMRYGRTRYQVEGAQGVEHQASIRSPSATLAIRGTQDVTMTDQRPGPASASSRGTRVFFRTAGNHKQVIFGSNSDHRKQTLEEGDSSPGQSSSRKRIVDTGDRHARNGADFQILNDFELYSGPQASGQSLTKIKIQRQATSQPSDGGGCCCGGGEGGGVGQ